MPETESDGEDKIVMLRIPVPTFDPDSFDPGP